MFQQLPQESAKIGLEMNISKTKFMTNENRNTNVIEIEGQQAEES